MASSSSSSQESSINSYASVLGEDAKDAKGLELVLFDFDFIAEATNK